MQDLRDKLRKAGLATKKQARKARAEARRSEKERGGQRSAAEREAERKREYAAKREAEAAAARAQQDKLNRERALHEAEAQLCDIIDKATRWRTAGERPFHFVARDQRVRRIYCGDEIARQLATGALAIVDAPHDKVRGYRVVSEAGARRLELLAPDRLLFWIRDEGAPPSTDPKGPTQRVAGPGATAEGSSTEDSA